MMNLCSETLRILQGKTLVTAESCTGGGIGHMLTSVPGSSAVYKGGIISYCDAVKAELLHVDPTLLATVGAVSAPVAEQMALGARAVLHADVAVSVTGLADAQPDDFGHTGGTVFIGYADASCVLSKEFHFAGSRSEVRNQAISAAFSIIIEKNR